MKNHGRLVKAQTKYFRTEVVSKKNLFYFTPLLEYCYLYLRLQVTIHVTRPHI